MVSHGSKGSKVVRSTIVGLLKRSDFLEEVEVITFRTDRLPVAETLRNTLGSSTYISGRTVRVTSCKVQDRSTWARNRGDFRDG